MFRRKHMPRLVNILAGQVGFLLPMAVMATLLGALAVLSVAALVAAQFRAQAEAEDNTQAYYVADAAIMAVASDLIRGANIAPLPPNDYVPPHGEYLRRRSPDSHSDHRTGGFQHHQTNHLPGG